MIELKKMHYAGMGAGLVVILISLFFMKSNAFFLIIGVGVLIGAFPFVFSMIEESRVAREKEEMFLEFARNLVESVKAGTPISRSILNVRNKPYGVLSENVRKLANQIHMGIPLNVALETFSKDVNNATVARALTLIGQAERAGGDIGEILEAVAEAVSLSEKLKKERKAVISTLVVQGYIIFFIFIVIILVMQFKILPMVSGIADLNAGGQLGSTGFGAGGGGISQEEISSSFLYLLLVQGLFSGLAIGKLAEGSVKSGIKHSFALVIMAFLVSAGARLFIA